MQTAQQAKNPDELSNDKVDTANVLAKTCIQQVWSNISIHLMSYFWSLSDSKSNSWQSVERKRYLCAGQPKQLTKRH